MIHANSLKNAKPLIQIKMNRDQIVHQYVLDEVCKEVKEADKRGESFIFLNLGERHFTKATTQILRLYGYRPDFHKDNCETHPLEYTYICWNKL